MQLIEYYHRMRITLATDEGGEVPVTLERLADILYCSPRNVKLLLKRMSERGWIRWSPGRGRGNRSLLAFLAVSDDLIETEAKRFAADGNMKAALELLNLPDVQPGRKERFFEWLAGHFGYRETLEREKRLDTLRLPYYAPILSLDPADMLYARDLHLVKQIFDTLVRFDPAERTIKPHLAHYWEADAQGMRWTFYLRKGVRFHHGRELTAEDAAFTLLRLKAKEQTSPNGWLAAPIKDVRALSRYTLEVGLNEPNYMFLHYASAAGMSIVPEDIYGKPAGTDVARYPVGTGPFRVTRNDECTCLLEAFPDYFRERAHLDRVEIWIMPGDCAISDDRLMPDGAGSLCDRAMHLASGCGDWKEVERVEQGCCLITFNMTRPGPQRQRNFRLAVHRLLDRAAMGTEVGSGQAYPAQGFFPPERPLQRDPDHDPEEAVRLLKEMGYAGEPLHMCLTRKHLEKGEWVAAQCAKFGIPVRIATLSLQDIGNVGKLREADCVLGGVVADEDGALSILEMVQVGNLPIHIYLGQTLKEELKRVIGAITREPSEGERLKRIGELEQMLKRDAHVLFLIHPRKRTTYNPIVKGVSLNSLGYVNFKDLWFRRAGEAHP